MKLQFDANQSYQLTAINAIISLFKGQPLNQSSFDLRAELLDVFNIVGDFIALFIKRKQYYG